MPASDATPPTLTALESAAAAVSNARRWTIIALLFASSFINAVHRAAVSVAQFKVRKGMPVGCSVTLRGARMYDFLDRLISVALPRVRDFRGLPNNAFDGRGNHNMGVKEQLIFTEIDYNKVTVTRGMNITIVTNAPTDAECKELLTLLGMPFRKK